MYNEANIEAETTLKFTPLIIACQKGHKEISQMLINAGADINSADIYNNTPLHYAAQNGSLIMLTGANIPNEIGYKQLGTTTSTKAKH